MKINFADVRDNPEFISSIIRYGFWLVTSAFIGMAMWTGYYEPAWKYYIYFSLSFFLYNSIVFMSIVYNPSLPSSREQSSLKTETSAFSIVLFPN